MSDQEQQLLTDAEAALVRLLREGPGLKLLPTPRESVTDSARYDAFWEVEGQGVVGAILVEVFTQFMPRAIDRLRLSLTPGKLRQMHDPTVLVVAPWFSPRSQALLEERGWGYLDLTGNVLMKMRRPAIYLRMQGADRDPQPRSRSQVLLRGTQINALVRLLVDVEPPYRLVDLAGASGLSKGYVSRALAALDEQRLINRSTTGVVESVDWIDVLRQRAAGYDLFKSNRNAGFIAPGGVRALMSRLAVSPPPGGVTITGSFAAAKVAQIAAPVQLALYVSSISDIAAGLELLPTTRGADVVLLEAADPSQIDRPRDVGGISHVGLSQLVLDLLTGNGRLPEEGEEVLQWMTDHPGWRLPQLPTPGNKQQR